MPFRRNFAVTCLLAAVASSSVGKSEEHPHDHAAHMAPAAAGAAVPAGARPRLVRYPTQLRDHTLSNMRDHLRALAEIQDHLARQDYAQAAEIAEQRLGMSSLQRHGAHEVARSLRGRNVEVSSSDIDGKTLREDDDELPTL